MSASETVRPAGTDPSGTFAIAPIVGACAAGAAVSVVFDLASNFLGGRKNDLGDLLGSAATGCVAGLAGLGIGKAADKLIRGAGSKVDDLLAQANRAYPKKVGREEWHHVQPKYLDGPKSGPQVQLPAPYHQLITNAFREKAGYGQLKPTAPRIQEIMREIYDTFPIGRFPIR